MKKSTVYALVSLQLLWFGKAEAMVKIRRISGDVRIRVGVEENWQTLEAGAELAQISTILTGEDSEVSMELEGGLSFTLGSNALLDVADLRKITDKDLFLFLTSQKINKIEYKDSRSKLHITDANVVRGEQKGIPSIEDTWIGTSPWRFEYRAARDLYDQRFFTNAIVKFHKILEKYPENQGIVPSYFFMAQAFEAIHLTGQALDSYEEFIQRSQDPADSWMIRTANAAVSRLK